jgi:16S rRNA (uracil1498-N3)-methyltransferase
MHLFYCSDITEGDYTLNEEESKHCIRVLRLRIGEIIHITDGAGNLYKTELIDDHPKRCAVKIVETQAEYGKKPYSVYMAVAPTKNINRYEWFLEKATEIGINQITPIICEHSERKEVKNQRLEKVIISAVKQSLKAYVPALDPAIKFRDFIKQDFEGQKFIAYCEGEPQLLKNLYKPKTDVLILIGPEGDFSPAEVEQAIDAGFTPVSLGKSRLRTETAAIAACHAVNLIND